MFIILFITIGSSIITEHYNNNAFSLTEGRIRCDVYIEWTHSTWQQYYGKCSVTVTTLVCIYWINTQHITTLYSVTTVVYNNNCHYCYYYNNNNNWYCYCYCYCYHNLLTFLNSYLCRFFDFFQFFFFFF